VGEKGLPGPIKARVHVTRSKKRLFVFFDAKGLIYKYYIPKVKTVNTEM
jgi:hypothetical protein